MAQRLINAATRRAALQYWGLDRDARTNLEKPPDLCYKDFLEFINGAGTATIPAMGHSSVDLSVAGSGAASNLVTIPLSAGSAIGGYVRATTVVTDGTDFQAFTEIIQFSAVNKAGTMTVTVTNLSTTGAKAVSAGTLTTTWALDTGTAGQVTLKVTPTTSLTATSFICHFEVGMSMSTPTGALPTFA